MVELESVKLPGMTTIDTVTLALLLLSGFPVAILDARTGEHDDGRRIPGAASPNAPGAAEELEKLIASRSTLIVAYGAGPDCPMRAELSQRLKELGYENVLDYLGGIADWQAVGYPTEEAGGP